MLNILVTGANGQLGQSFFEIRDRYPGWNWIFTDRTQLDITRQQDIDRFFAGHSINVCINCAAYTAVDLAESEPEKARLINVEAPRLLARACHSSGAVFVHFSSDYVYHSPQNYPYSEEAPTAPQSVYARTKWEGEMAALAENPATLVFRTSWVYAWLGKNFLQTILRLGAERPSLRVVYDQIGTPTYAPDLARAVCRCLELILSEKVENWPGIYNFSNEGVCSWYDFALAIVRLAGLDCQITPILSAEYPTAAKRPPYSVLQKEKIKKVFGLQIPHWLESLEGYFKN